MAARPYWKGQIRLALVSIPVEVYSATKSGATIAFNQIHEPTGKRIKYEKVVPGVGPVEPEDIVKGYQYEKGSYVLLKEEEIEAVKLESKKTLELTQFVDHDEIDVLYFEKPYYVVPADDLAEEAFVVLRDALRESRKVGIGQLAMRGQEYVIALKPCGKGMLMETLRYADEVNRAASIFREIGNHKPDPDLLDLAATLIESDGLAAVEPGFDLAIANPPFMSPKGGIRPHNRFQVQSKRSEVLFVDYIAEHLNPKGRAAIVVPEGIIFQSSNYLFPVKPDHSGKDLIRC